MSAPDMRRAPHGTAGARVAPGAATGPVRTYGMARGEGASSSPVAPAEGVWAQGGYLLDGQGYPGQTYVQPAFQQQAGQGTYAVDPYGQAPYAQLPAGYAYGQAAYQAPVTSQPVPVKKSRKGRIIAIIVALIALVLAALLLLALCAPDAKSRRQGDAGQLAGKSEAEIQAELDRVVEEGMFNISVASVVEFENGSAPGELRIENVPGNRYLMRVTLLRNDTGEQIYITDLIEPNHHIQQDTLDVVLPAGTYECTALFEAFDPVSEEQIGQAAAIITLNVLS